MLNRDDLIHAVANRQADRDEQGHWTGIKRRESDRVAGDVEAYLARGGRIEHVPNGMQTLDYTCERAANRAEGATERRYKNPATALVQLRKSQRAVL